MNSSTVDDIEGLPRCLHLRRAFLKPGFTRSERMLIYLCYVDNQNCFLLKSGSFFTFETLQSIVLRLVVPCAGS